VVATAVADDDEDDREGECRSCGALLPWGTLCPGCEHDLGGRDHGADDRSDDA
jgi:hypothetical protein